MPVRLELARLPTPLVRLERLSAELGIDLWCKRDDLTGLGLSGNKVRKLEYLLGAAVAAGADTVITTGGMQSNHARATAIAARMLGLHPVLLLRGAPDGPPEGNLLLDRLLGAEIHWCTPEEYRSERNERMAELARGRAAFVVPEGGSNALGAQGFVHASQEVADQGGAFDAVVCAVGSGGTLAGLALGQDIGPVHGVAVCDDGPYFSDIVRRIADEAGAALSPQGDRWRVVEGYQGPAYGVATPEIWDTIAVVARLEGLLLDPVYTGKAMHALVREARSGRMRGRVLFWHTGGVFGLFGRGNEVPA